MASDTEPVRSERTAIVVIGGDAPTPEVVDHLPPSATVIGADSGLDHAEALGLPVHEVVGDLDSVSPAALARARAAGAVVHQHPTDKDATDAELALARAIDTGHHHLVVVSGGGGRLDHLLASLQALIAPARHASVEAWIGDAHVVVAHGPRSVTIHARPGELVSLVPLDGAVDGIRTTGLRWSLHDEPLPLGTSRGVSNEAVATEITVFLTHGTLAVIRPHALTGALPA